MIPFGYAGKPLPAANRTAARAARLPAQAVPFRPLRLCALEHGGRLGGVPPLFPHVRWERSSGFLFGRPDDRKRPWWLRSLIVPLAEQGLAEHGCQPMQAELRSWLEEVFGASLLRHEPLPVEASHRRFYRVCVAGEREGVPLASKGSAGEREGVPPAEERSADERRRLSLAVKASAWKRKAVSTADDGSSANANADSSFVVMESPPSLERNDAFVAMQRLFSAAGLPVPGIVAMDRNAGFFVLTDLGNRSLEDAYRGPHRNLALELAVTHLVRLQGIAPDGVPAYEESRFRDELHIFVEWFLGRFLQQAPAAALASVFEALVANVLAQPQCLIHRDYHCRNLLLDAKGRFGIVDFQDALVGPVTYDLACLLWDCYHYFDAAERRRWLRRHQERARFPNGDDGSWGEASSALLPPAAKGGSSPSEGASSSPLKTRTSPAVPHSGGQGSGRFHSDCGWDEAALTRALDLTALQRQFKAVGIFARLWLRDGKPTHLRYIAPVLDAMQEIAVLYPEVQGLHPWLQRLAAEAAKAVQTVRTAGTTQ